MEKIEFIIGPSNQEQHDFVYTWLKANNYEVRGISYIGDHFSEIYCVGNYAKAHRKLADLPSISFENWN